MLCTARLERQAKTIASVVIKRPAIDDPSCSAMRTTLVGSELAALGVEAVGIGVILNDLADDD